MRKIYFAETSAYGFLPYVWGLLRAFTENDPGLRSEYRWMPPLYLPTESDGYLERMKEPSVFAASCYLWNNPLALALVRRVKRKHPECLTVFGGPNVPLPPRSIQYLVANPGLDVIVHYEGETTFRALLRELARPSPDLSRVRGITFRAPDGRIISTEHAESELPKQITTAIAPSAFQSGYFDEIIAHLMKTVGFFVSALETNRGCPYACTFCEWGDSMLTKMRFFETDRVAADLEYLAHHQMQGLDIADNNFGMYQQDVELSRHLARIRKETGFPKYVYMSWSKSKPEYLFQAASILHEAGLLPNGITLATESTDSTVLKAIKRKNNDAAFLQRRCDDVGMPTYVELVFPLPLETTTSFKNGLCDLIETGHRDVRAYENFLLPNTEMYLERDKYQLETVTRVLNKTARLSAQQNGGVGIDPAANQELDCPPAGEIVVSTSTLSRAEVCETLAFNDFVTLNMHMGSYARFLQVFLQREGVLGARDLYIPMFDALKGEGLLGELIHELIEIRRVFAEDASVTLYDMALAQPMVRQFLEPYRDPSRGSVKRVWLPYEFGWMWIHEHFDAAYRQISAYLHDRIPVDRITLKNGLPLAEVLPDLLRYQQAMMLRLDYDPQVGKTAKLDFNWPMYFFEEVALEKEQVEVAFRDTHMGTAGTAFIPGHKAGFAAAAVGDYFPLGRNRRFHHQPDRCIVTSSDGTSRALRWPRHQFEQPAPRKTLYLGGNPNFS